MKKLLLVLVLSLVPVLTQAADVVINIQTTVKDADVSRLVAYVDTLPDLYTYETNGIGSNAVVTATLVPETSKQKFKRHASVFLDHQVTERVKKYERRIARESVPADIDVGSE